MRSGKSSGCSQGIRSGQARERRPAPAHAPACREEANAAHPPLVPHRGTAGPPPSAGEELPASANLRNVAEHLRGRGGKRKEEKGEMQELDKRGHLPFRPLSAELFFLSTWSSWVHAEFQNHNPSYPAIRDRLLASGHALAQGTPGSSARWPEACCRCRGLPVPAPAHTRGRSRSRRGGTSVTAATLQGHSFPAAGPKQSGSESSLTTSAIPMNYSSQQHLSRL